MERTDKRYQAYMRILSSELVPAMGCTEPISIAYAAAKAREVLGKLPERVEIDVSDNIIKNVKSVVVPNTGGLKGIPAAAAVGIVAGDASRMLEVISVVTYEQRQETVQFLAEVPININRVDSDIIFDIWIRLYADNDEVKVRISEYHTHIVLVEKNGVALSKSSVETEVEKLEPDDKISDKDLLDIKGIYEFANSCDLSEIEPLLARQVEYNLAISNEGISSKYGANIGKTFLKFYGDSVINRAKAKAAAASDARMSGCELPVIINSGSGNQGITVSIPVYEYAEELGVEKEKLFRALIISNLVAIHVKRGMGRLSAYCGVASAGCASGCGIAYLDGGGYEEISSTLTNSLAIVSGVICDGAKPSCAAKIATGVEAGIIGYHMQKDGQTFSTGDGIVGDGIEDTIDNVARLASEGMKLTDKEIIAIMMKN